MYYTGWNVFEHLVCSCGTVWGGYGDFGRLKLAGGRQSLEEHHTFITILPFQLILWAPFLINVQLPALTTMPSSPLLTLPLQP